MTMPSIGSPLSYGLVAEQDRTQQARDQQAENTSRSAVFTYEHVTKGPGQVTLSKPVAFGLDYLTQPALTSGVVIDKLPDLKYWLYPMSQAGVARWQTRPNPADPERPFYTGAFLYFVTQIDPIYTQRTDGSLVELWRRRVAEAPDSARRIAAEKALKEQEFALYLSKNPPKDVAVRHHLRFEAVALKGGMDLAAKAGDVSQTITDQPRFGTGILAFQA